MPLVLVKRHMRAMVVNEHGRVAALVAIESQDIAEIPIRSNDGATGSDREDLTCRSITFGLAYRK
jgi:hypothetical protein